MRHSGDERGWFDWAACPYRGCRARPCDEGLVDEDPWTFQDRSYAEPGFAEALRRDLRTRVRPGDHIAFGAAVDPYRPLENRERVMRAALRAFAGVRGLRVSITTKSSLVSRDIDLLARIARHNSVQVNFSIATPDRRLARVLEPGAPGPRSRFAALHKVRKAGIEAGIFLMPLLPGMTDAMPDLVQLFRAARDCGASFVVPAVVFLREPSRSAVLADLHAHYPRVAARYEVWLRTKPQQPASIRDEVLSRVGWLANRFHVPVVGSDHPPEPARPTHQTTFAFG